ncbi:MAG: hypothetical protein FWE06_04500 [Oscillospiraceae bacterium]|nr:hypothetical protein [Oscillospiraceae bacterium]
MRKLLVFAVSLFFIAGCAAHDAGILLQTSPPTPVYGYEETPMLGAVMPDEVKWVVLNGITYGAYVDDTWVQGGDESVDWTQSGSAANFSQPRSVSMYAVVESPEVVTRDMVNAVRDLLDERGLTVASANIDQVAMVDLLGNGRVQTIIAANTPQDEDGAVVTDDEIRSGDAGVYSFLMIVDGENVTLLYERYRQVDSREAEVLEQAYLIVLDGVYDVNRDGVFEIFFTVASAGAMGHVDNMHFMHAYQGSAWRQVLQAAGIQAE